MKQWRAYFAQSVKLMFNHEIITKTEQWWHDSSNINSQKRARFIQNDKRISIFRFNRCQNSFIQKTEEPIFQQMLWRAWKAITNVLITSKSKQTWNIDVWFANYVFELIIILFINYTTYASQIRMLLPDVRFQSDLRKLILRDCL